MSDIGLNAIRQPAMIGIPPADAPRVGRPAREVPAARADLAALPLPQAARQEAAPRIAARQTGIFGRIKAASQQLLGKIKSAFAPATYGLAESYTFSVPGHANPVTFPRAAFLDMIKDLPKGERAAAVANLQEIIQHRIFQGHELMQCILDMPTGGPSAPSAQDVADLTLFLQAKAFAIDEGFESGAFSIEDPDGKLANYLERSPDLYLRSSTHLSRFQNDKVDGHRNTQRGIDFAEGPRRALPFSRRTVVFGTIPPFVSPDTGEFRGARRLYLKPETHGCRISTRSFGATFHSDRYRADFGAVTNPRGWTKSDIGSALMHLGSLISKRSEHGRRESLPKDIRNDMNKLARNHPEFAARVGLTYRSDKDDPTRGAGIRVFLDGMSRIPPQETPEAARVLRDKIADLWPDQEKNLARLGNEVMLNLNQLG